MKFSGGMLLLSLFLAFSFSVSADDGLPPGMKRKTSCLLSPEIDHLREQDGTVGSGPPGNHRECALAGLF